MGFGGDAWDVPDAALYLASEERAAASRASSSSSAAYADALQVDP